MKGADPFARPEEAGDICLRVLATTDLHCEIMAYDYYTDRPDDAVGLVRAATLLRTARAEARNALTLDAGDFLQGAPVGDLWAEEPGRLATGPHPMIAAMAAAGVEASTLGNHDFNYGLPYLEQCLAGAPFAVVNANVVRDTLAARAEDDMHLIAPYTILERAYLDRSGASRALRVGIIGFCPPQIMA